MKFEVMENGNTHLGDIEAPDYGHAQNVARQQFPYARGLTVNPINEQAPSGKEDVMSINANPTSLASLRRGMDYTMGHR